MTFFWCLDLGPFRVLNCIRKKKKRALGRDLVLHNVGRRRSIPKDVVRTCLSLTFMAKAKGGCWCPSLHTHPSVFLTACSFFRWSVYIICSKTEHLYICAYIPSLTLLKCILLSKMLCSNSQEQNMERVRNANFMVY